MVIVGTFDLCGKCICKLLQSQQKKMKRVKLFSFQTEPSLVPFSSVLILFYFVAKNFLIYASSAVCLMKTRQFAVHQRIEQ